MNRKWDFQTELYFEPSIDESHYLSEWEITVRVHGYHADAVMYLRNGDPGYPEEGENEKEIVGISICGVNIDPKKDKALFDKLCDELAKWLNEQDIDIPDDCDYDDRDD